MNRPNRFLAVALAVILALAIVAVVVSASRPTTRLAAGSPGAVVQHYLEAMLDGRFDDAADLLDPGGDCGADDLAMARNGMPDPIRVVVRDSAVDGSSGRVRVDVIHTEGPFGSVEYTEPVTYRLARVNGTWHLVGFPWPLSACNKGG